MIKRGKRIILAISVFAMIMCSSNIAAGKIIYVDDDANGLNNGSSWENAYVYLPDALADANSSEKPIEIHVAQGTYITYPYIDQNNVREATFQLINDVNIIGGFAGITETNPDDRNIKQYQTILSGDIYGNDLNGNVDRAENSYHVVTSSGTDETAVLDGFTIKNGYANGSDDSRKCGAGLYNIEGSPTIINCTFSNNTANLFGGGMYSISGEPVISDCNFSNNISGKGGGIFQSQSNLTLNNCSFSLNKGAGVYTYDVNATLNDCVFIKNIGYTFGGGLAADGTISGPQRNTINVNNCKFICNTVQGSRAFGGGLYSNCDNIIISNCLFNSNTAKLGGGCFIGGNIGSGILTITNCTSVWDMADLGSFLYYNGYYGNISIRNTIAWYNENPLFFEKSQAQNLSINFSNIHGGWSGQGNIDEDPLFIDPFGQDLIGGTEDDDLRFSLFSPCIDSGDPYYIAAINETDLDDNARIVSGRIDMGAYEFKNVVYVDDDANGLNDGSSWENAFCYLQDALNTVPTGYQILVAQGFYTPDLGFLPDEDTEEEYGIRESTFRLYDNITIRGGYAGVYADNPDARDYKLYKTILSGDLNGNDIDVNTTNNLIEDISREDNCFHIITCDSNSIIDGFVITGGRANGEQTSTGNYEKKGGALYNTGSPTILNCTFNWNYASEAGGAIYSNGGDLHLTNCVFSCNSAPNYGGGLLIQNSNSDITDCYFENNNSSYGGGIYCYSTNLNLDNCEFIKNIGSTMGGGLFILNKTATLNNCRFIGNTANLYGGGIFDASENTCISGCLFSGNNANQGGGCHSDSTLTITNCTSAWNTAAGSFLRYAGDNGKIINTIVRHDTINNVYAQSLSVYFSNILGNWPGHGNIDINPFFVDPLGPDLVGGTEDDNLRLSPISPCVDSGQLSYEPIFTETDLDGNPRIVGDNIDMGAYEFQRDIYVDDNAPYDNDSIEEGTRNHPLNNIQEAIDIAKDGYKILVLPGLYDKINFLGKAITVAGIEGAAVIEPETGPGPNSFDQDAVTFYSGEDSNSVLKNFIIKNSGLAISLNYGSSPTIQNITFVDNLFGIAAYEDSNPDIRNCIFYNNTNGDLFGCKAWYSCFKDANLTKGNFYADPLFVDAANGDYHLKSEGWRWNEQNESWTWDEVTSPCIDAGDPCSPLGDEPMSISRDPNNSFGLNQRINMGAYGGTPQASMPPLGWIPLNNEWYIP